MFRSHTALVAGLLAATLGETARADAPDAGPPSESEVQALRRDLTAVQAELEAQRTASATGDEAPVEPSLRLYGFMDMGVNKLFLPSHADGNIILPTRATTFVLGNVNLYLDMQPQKDWSGLVEVRLTNYPQGTDVAANPGTTALPIDNRIFDSNSTNPYTPIRWGAIVLERAYVQYHWSDLLQLRVGFFLTPFGIWNIDHGTPTVISLMLPQFEVTELFPIHQLGVEALGSTLVGDWRVGYFAYLSNGRTPGQLDPTEDKMVGGRVYASRLGRARLTLGLSAFHGRYSEVSRSITSFNPIGVTSTEVTAYHETGLGADVSLDVGQLRLRAEVAHHLVLYDSGKRPVVWRIPGVYAADSTETSGYVIAAYRLPWARLEPYVYVEPYRWPTLLGEGLIMLSGGLNAYFGDSAQIKLQYTREIYMSDWSSFTTRPNDPGAHFVLGRVVLLF